MVLGGEEEDDEPADGRSPCSQVRCALSSLHQYISLFVWSILGECYEQPKKQSENVAYLVLLPEYWSCHDLVSFWIQHWRLPDKVRPLHITARFAEVCLHRQGEQFNQGCKFCL